MPSRANFDTRHIRQFNNGPTVEKQLMQAFFGGCKTRIGTVVEMACSSLGNAGKQLLLNRAGPHSALEARPIAFGAVVRSTVSVQCDTLDSILRGYAASKQSDLLSIDIEGHELVALSGFSFDRDARQTSPFRAEKIARTP